LFALITALHNQLSRTRSLEISPFLLLHSGGRLILIPPSFPPPLDIPNPHVTLCYDHTGCSTELETIYRDSLGTLISVTFVGLAEGKEGSAFLVEVPQVLWHQSGLVSPHVTLTVNEGYSAKSLGFLIAALRGKANPSLTGRQTFPEGT